MGILACVVGNGFSVVQVDGIASMLLSTSYNAITIISSTSIVFLYSIIISYVNLKVPGLTVI